MNKLTPILLLMLAMSACTTKAKGWPADKKDELVNACVEATKKGAALDEGKVKEYCSCYQQKLESKYPDFMELAKLSEDQLTKLAEECLPIIVK